jgi:lipid A 3-O-deacylase
VPAVGRTASPLGLFLAAALFFVAAPSRAQGPTVWRLSTDNDALALWRDPASRSDREYTGGVFATLEYSGRSKWLNRDWPFRKACAPPCATSTHSWTIGQELYTGHHFNSENFANSIYRRPNAAWLYLELSERDSTPRGTSTLSVAAGVVGPPALGPQTQRLLHDVLHESDYPFDWRLQIPFEPGFVVRYDRNDAVIQGTIAGIGLNIGTRTFGALGTIQLGLGVGARAQIDLPAPPAGWELLLPRVRLAVDATEHLAFRNEFVDGTTFRESKRMEREDRYEERRFSIEARWRHLGVIYRGARTGKQYSTQLAEHQWGSIALEWRPGG